MEEWIKDVVRGAVSGLRSAIDAVAQRLAAIYSFVLTILVNLKSAFGVAVNGIIQGLNKLIQFGRETYTTMRWIVVVRIPAVVSSAVNSAINWTVQQINNARLYARQLYDAVTKWAVEQIRSIIATINSFRDWAYAKVGGILTSIGRLNLLVFTLLTSPERMARWVIDALVAELWRYLDRNADRIFTYIRSRSIYYTLRFANRIEDMISRLL